MSVGALPATSRETAARHRGVPVLLLAVAAVGVTACGARARARPGEGSLPPDPCRVSATQSKLESVVTVRRNHSETTDYAVAPGDLLVVTIYNYRPEGGDFSSDVRIDDRGYISFPMLAPIHVAGLTLPQVRRAVVHALQHEEVLREPLVSAFLKDYQGQQVVVLGAVVRPGLYSLSRGRQAMIDVLSMAGGLAANAGNYVLFRPAAPPAPDDEAAAPAPLADAFQASNSLHSGQVDANMMPICIDAADGGTNPAIVALYMQGGDVVVVPEAGQAFIEGEVKTPGHYPLVRGVTLTQLISSAGGPRFPANLRRVKLIRRAADGDSAEWELDLGRIQRREQPDVRLERNDSIVVPGTPGRKIVYGVYEFVTAIVRVTVGGAATIF